MKIDITALVLGSEDYNYMAELVETGQSFNPRKAFIDQLSIDYHCDGDSLDWLSNLTMDLNINEHTKINKIFKYIEELFISNNEICDDYVGDIDEDGAIFVTCKGLQLDENKLKSL